MMLSVGVDIAKDKIDVYSKGSYAQVSNDAKSIKAHFKSYPKDSHVVMEATGKYHRVAHEVFEEIGLEVMVINPFQSRNFAKAMNLLCKTDKVDAKLLSIFGERMEFKPTKRAEPLEREIQELSRHLDDLKKLKRDLELRLKESDGFISRSLKAAIKTLDKQIAETEKRLKETFNQDEQLQERLRVLVSIPGIGETTGIYLLSFLRELGTLNKREIAALSGLAPVNNDSGKFTGKRRIKGGRHDVRRHLYMPTLGSVTRHNPRLKTIYEDLVARGKPKKVAITACMRKLVVWANAMLATNTLWEENIA